MGFKSCAIALIAAAASIFEPGLLAARPGATPPPDIVVTTTAELEAALSPGNAGARILVRAGDYDVSQALTVPEGVTLAGEGVMSFDESGLPTGFDPFGRTVLRATAALAGDVLTLGDGATIQGLVIQDLAGRSLRGSPVVVLSRAAGDFISAHIEACEIINPNSAGQGLSGRGLVVATRNTSPPHVDAVLRVHMTQSIVRSPAPSAGVFAINFASHARIELDLEHNVIGGGLGATAGVGTPDAVTGASMTIQSRRNLYRSDSPAPTPTGWGLFAGADSPLPLIVSQASTFNTLQMHSMDDTLAGFATGIAVAGARRINALSEPMSSNSVEMDLLGTRLLTTLGDLRLSGANSLAGGAPGDDNTLRVLVRQATGSGLRANQYNDSRTPSMTNLGTGNRLEIIGNANAFDDTNTGFNPPPPAEFFTVQR